LVLASGENVKLTVRVVILLLPLPEHPLPRGPIPTTGLPLVVLPDLLSLVASPAGESVRLPSNPVVAEPILGLLRLLPLALLLVAVRRPWTEAVLALVRRTESSLLLPLGSLSLRHEQPASGFLLT
jgi:hypothetical protein